MTAEQREHVFEPFYSTKEEGKGTGLGLSMVYGFIERSRGQINVYSELGIGTTFRLYLPRAKDVEQAQASSTKQEQPTPHGTGTILVVDDEADFREQAVESLQSLGYRVLSASDGEQALIVLAEEAVDLLFSDVVMPGGMNGYELAEQATDYHPNLKVLLTSGYTEEAAQNNAQARFSANLLRKPYVLAELAQYVQMLLSAPIQDSVAHIEWTDTLSVGIEAVDDDHQMLVEILICSQQANESECQTMLGEIIDLMVSHF